MTQTENYNLTLVEGSDKVNLLTQMNPNTTAIDTQMKDNADHGIQDATELFTSTVHAITRQNPDAPIFRFTAVSNFTAGETFTVDGVQVTALLTSGEALTTGSFIIGSEVICALRDTLLTVFVNAGTAAIAKNAEKLGGELPEYYGTAEDVADAVESATTALETANGANTAVGNLSSLTTATKTSVVGAVNEVNENLTKLTTWTTLYSKTDIGGSEIITLPNEYSELEFTIVGGGSSLSNTISKTSFDFIPSGTAIIIGGFYNSSTWMGCGYLAKDTQTTLSTRKININGASCSTNVLVRYR